MQSYVGGTVCIIFIDRFSDIPLRLYLGLAETFHKNSYVDMRTGKVLKSFGFVNLSF